MDKLIDEFLEYLDIEKNYSEYTIINYRDDLEKFNDFLKSEGISVTKTTYGDIRGFIAYLYNKKEATKSITRNISSLRSFYKYLIRNNKIKENPMLLISNPKQDKLLPHYLTEEEIELLLKVTDKDDLYDIRDNLIIELLYSTGIRVSELVNIKISDIDLNEESIKVFGKGKKMRIVYFGDTCKNKIKKYLSVRKDNNEYLLLNKRGSKLSDRSVRKIFEDIIRLNHLDIAFSPHTLRHTYATHMLNDGADVRTVQELLGHASVSTTGIYTHVSNEHLRQVYLNSHPRGK